MITVGGFSFVRLVLVDALRLARRSAEPPTSTGWATWAPDRLWPLWGVALAIATAAYHDRRRDPAAVAAADHRVNASNRPGPGRAHLGSGKGGHVKITSTGHATASPSQPVSSWVKAAAYAVPLCVLPSALWRLWKLVDGLPPGCQQLMRAWEPWYVAALSVGSFGAALLTIGLVRPWGEVVPRWVPFLGGRTVPVRAAVIAAGAGASSIFGVYAYALLNLVLRFRPTPQILGCPPPTEEPGAWVAIASYAPLLAWGPLLVVVSVAYYRRRTRPGRPTGTPSGRRGRPGSGRPSRPC